MHREEERVSGNLVYRGRILNLRLDNVRLPNGRRALREVVEHAPAVAIVAETREKELLLVRQFRYPAGESLLEVPAGLVEPGESSIETAVRELQEETGYSAGKIEEICRFYTSPGFSNEMIILFHASDLVFSPKECDPDEFLDLERISREKAAEYVLDGNIKDAKTLTAIYWYLSRQ